MKVNILSILYFDLSNIKTIYFVLLLKMLFLFCRYYISAISQSSDGSFNLESLAFERFIQYFFLLSAHLRVIQRNIQRENEYLSFSLRRFLLNGAISPRSSINVDRYLRPK